MHTQKNKRFFVRARFEIYLRISFFCQKLTKIFPDIVGEFADINVLEKNTNFSSSYFVIKSGAGPHFQEKVFLTRLDKRNNASGARFLDEIDVVNRGVSLGTAVFRR